MYWVITSLHAVLIVLAFCVGAFVMWRTTEHEHVDELPLFVDKLVLSFIASQALVKVPYLLLNGALLIRDPLIVLRDAFSYSANEFIVPVFLATLFLSLQSAWKDRFALLDYVVVSSALLLGLLLSVETIFALGGLMLVDATMATYTAVIMSGVGAVYFLILSRVLIFLEQRYRTFFWYRYRRSSAQSGFVLAVFCTAFGVYSLVRLLLQLPFALGSLAFVELLASLVTLLAGFVILYIRSGRLRLR